MTPKKPLYRYMREREKHAAAVSKQIGEYQRKLAKTNTLLMGDSDMTDDKPMTENEDDPILIEAAQLIDESNELISKQDFIEERALDNMEAMLEMQQRLDAVNAGVTVKVAETGPRPPEEIMADAMQLHAWLEELKVEFAAWEAMQPVETAH